MQTLIPPPLNSVVNILVSEGWLEADLGVETRVLVGRKLEVQVTVPRLGVPRQEFPIWKSNSLGFGEDNVGDKFQ